MIGGKCFDLNFRLTGFGPSESKVMGGSLRSPSPCAQFKKLHYIHCNLTPDNDIVV
jgi:hypothetical protein